MMRQVIASFVKNAPAGSKLLFKQHPLDNGLERWHKVLRHIAREFKIEDRVVFIEEGDLHDILQKTAGVVIVNSTVGLHSLRAQKPTIVLGCAVFDVPGLTHQGRLDDFWKRPEPVDPELMRDLVKAMAATIQIKGDFFNKAGRQAAIGAMVQRVIEGTVNMPDAFIDPPPRLTSPKGILTVLGRPVELDWEEDAAVPDMTYARSGPIR